MHDAFCTKYSPDCLCNTCMHDSLLCCLEQCNTSTIEKNRCNDVVVKCNFYKRDGEETFRKEDNND